MTRVLLLLLTLFVTLFGKSLIDNDDKKAEIQAPSHRFKRYLGQTKKFKLNRRYQECLAPGDVPGHCKHVQFCAHNVLGTTRGSVDYLCIIEKTHVGVCCPDDVLLSGMTGSRIIMDLPAGGTDYDDDNEDKNSGCGLSYSSRFKSATGETKSTVQEWPWIAAFYRVGGNEQHFCGGALITDQHILSAAHCFQGLEPGGIRVRLGEYDFRNPNETRYRDFMVIEITNHAEFQLSTYSNDIAIVKLKEPTAFNSYIWPICLPPTNRTYENEIAHVAGWGQIYYGGPTSTTLLEIAIPIWEFQKCIDAFLQLTENNICAAAYEGGMDSCLGDSGGPLLYKLENGRWVTIGVVSWGIGCGDQGQPGVYLLVDKYIPWIIENTIAN